MGDAAALADPLHGGGHGVQGGGVITEVQFFEELLGLVDIVDEVVIFNVEQSHKRTH